MTVRVEADKPGRTVPPSFAGLSIEYPDIPSFMGSPSAPNVPFIRLMQTLGSYGNGAPTIRVGGGSTDQSWWNPDGLPRPKGTDTNLNQAWVNSLATVATKAGTPVVVGLNLALLRVENARKFAEAVLTTLPAGSVRSFELGNEPDLFVKPRVFHVGKRVFVRPQHRTQYDFNTYMSEIDPYLAGLRDLRTPLAVGGFAGRAFSSKTSELLGRTRGRAQELAAHTYALQTCGAGRKRSKAYLADRLLLSRGSLDRIARLVAIAKRNKIPLRVSETNSAICGGVREVSDSFATALWGTDMLFGYLKAGVVGVNFHSWNGAWYAPVQITQQGGRPATIVHPLFYGMLLFSKATAGRAQLLTSNWRGHDSVRVWSTKAPDGTVRIVLLNTTRQIQRKMRIRVPGVSGPATVERLTGPSLGARTGTKLAGRSYGNITITGEMSGRFSKANVRRGAGVYKLNLPAASGAMVEISPR